MSGSTRSRSSSGSGAGPRRGQRQSASSRRVAGQAESGQAESRQRGTRQGSSRQSQARSRQVGPRNAESRRAGTAKTESRRTETRRAGARSTAQRKTAGQRSRVEVAEYTDARPRRWLLPGILLLITAGVLVLYLTPLFGVKTVKVQGVRTVTEAEALHTAQVPLGQPLMRVDTEEIRQRLSRLKPVADARVDVVWPSSVRLDIVERQPAAFFRDAKGIHLTDAHGIAFADAARPPINLPELRVPSGPEQARAASLSLQVLGVLPRDLRGQVEAVEAVSQRDIRLLLSGGRHVHWGSAAEPERKVAVLPPLLTRPGKVYDVSSPGLVTVA